MGYTEEQTGNSKGRLVWAVTVSAQTGFPMHPTWRIGERLVWSRYFSAVVTVC